MQHTARVTSLRGSGIAPDDVFSTLRKHMLVDGLDIVIDYEKSRGSYLVDLRSGKSYLDFFTFVASSPVGFNHPKMTTPDFVEKIGRIAINKPSNSDIYTSFEAEFLATFERVAMPSSMPHVFFIEGGALGVENALKAAFDWKIRKNFARGYREERGRQVIHFLQSFHGRSGYTLSLTNTDPAKTDLFPKFPWPRVLNPKIRFPLTSESIKDVEQREQESIGQIKGAFHANKDDIAAIIVETIQGEGGDNHFRPEFFRALRQLADENEAMLILDEVQTGIGLTGKMWGFQHFVEPDMITFGKKTQVCGFLSGRRIDEVEENVFRVPSRINSTWGGNLVDMVRSQRYLEIIEEENLVENARVEGEFLVRELESLAKEFPSVVSNARGRGLFASFDVAAPDRRKAFLAECFKKGLIMLPSGTHSVRFRPPLNISREDLKCGLSIIKGAIQELQ